MKILFLIISVTLLTASALAQERAVLPASQTEVDAGVIGSKFVSPKTLGGWNLNPSTNFNGALITNLNGSQITSGTVADPRLSTNVMLYSNGSTVRPEDFGAAPATYLQANVSATNGSPTVYCAAASFTSADIGKIVYLNQDSTNSSANTLYSSIIAVPDSHRVTLANNATFTRTTDSLRYGVNCAAAIQAAYDYCYSFNVCQNVFFGGRLYLVGGALDHTNYNEFSLIHFGADTYTSGNPVKTVRLLGSAPAMNGTSGYFQYPTGTNGTTIYGSAAKYDTNGYSCLIGANCVTNTFTSLNLHLENLRIEEPTDPQLTAVNCSYGGSLAVVNCSIDVDYSANNIAQKPYPGNTAIGIWFPNVSNNSDMHMDYTDVNGYSIGVWSGEHLIINGGKIGLNGIGIWGDKQPVTLHAPQLVANTYNLAADQTFPSTFQGTVWFEGFAQGVTTADIHDPNGKGIYNLTLVNAWPVTDCTNGPLEGIMTGSRYPNDWALWNMPRIVANHLETVSENVTLPGSIDTNNTVLIGGRAYLNFNKPQIGYFNSLFNQNFESLGPGTKALVGAGNAYYVGYNRDDQSWTGYIAASNFNARAAFELRTNYVASQFLPESGKVKICCSNNWLYTVTSTATNALLQVSP